jgi:hypothetical protein
MKSDGNFIANRKFTGCYKILNRLCMGEMHIINIELCMLKGNNSYKTYNFNIKVKNEQMVYSFFNHIGGVMVSMLASSAVDRGFKPKTIKLYIAVASPLNTQHLGELAKICWFFVGRICPNGATSLTANCCFSELAL